MIDLIILGAIGLVIVVSAAGLVWLKRRPRRIKADYFQAEWRQMQKLCKSKDTWAQAILEADDLLDKALKRKRFAGKSMGERLVSAQRLINDNDGVWFGHKLRNRLDEDPALKLKESDVKQALVGIRQALKDLGALPGGKADANAKESK
ncbi:MAG TPA: hypothetical protein VD735_00855 [Candidatus Saccharimonadales bacterium]|nr:hypothetical protein [Candidatus Saccharimonadales bacterium]